MKIKLTILLVLLAVVTALQAQPKDIERLIDAYDLLYYNRTLAADSINDDNLTPEELLYNNFSYSEKLAILNHADSIIRDIKKIKKIKKKFPFTYAQYQFEYYTLKLLCALDTNSITDYTLIKKYADSVDICYYVKVNGEERQLLSKQLGIRYLSLFTKKEEFYSLISDPYDGILSAILRIKIKYPESYLNPENTDIKKITDLQDFLFVHRINDSVIKLSDINNRYQYARGVIATIKDTSALRQQYPYTFKAMNFEYNWLRWQLINDDNNPVANDQKFKNIDTLLKYFPSDFSGTAEEAERLKDITGIERFTIVYRNNDTVYPRLKVAYNQFLLSFINTEIKKSTDNSPLNFLLIDSLHRCAQRLDYLSSDSNLMVTAHHDAAEIEQLFNYSNGIKFLQRKKYDSSYYYFVVSAIIKGLKYKKPVEVSKEIPLYKKDALNSLQSYWLKNDVSRIDSAEIFIAKKTMNYDFANELFNYDIDLNHLVGDLNEVVVIGYGSARLKYPPRPSCRADRMQFKQPVKTMYEANDILSSALRSAHYPQWDYFEVNDGFAIVAPFEQLESDGSPKPEPERFQEKISIKEGFSFSKYFRALLGGLEGYYRVLIFIVTDEPIGFDNTDNSLSLYSFEGGENGLPKEIKPDTPYTKDYSCSVLVYEFEKPQKNDPAKFIVSARHNAKEHLNSASLLNIFK